MARRLYKSTADYLAIAVTPVLIMALVTSLVFFLLLVFYRGGFQARLQYILFLFVFAAVLIARIAMEEGRERAMVFSLALAVAAALAVNRFSDLSLLANLFLLGLIWWCADRLTWDCTLIDEHENVSGEGLLQTVGLDEPSAPERGDGGEADVELFGVTTHDGPTERKPAWRRLWDHFHKPRAPGVWVVYFSLAALPIFGFGQRFISGDEPRRAAFRYLVLYVASALGLLLSTCFLGLRRYLRQRRVEMPDKMATVWIATGCGLIVALLVFCTLLPRPSAEYAVSQVPLEFSSPKDLLASRFGWGDEGTEDDETPGSAQGDKQNSAGDEGDGAKPGDTGSQGESHGQQRSASQSDGASSGQTQGSTGHDQQTGQTSPSSSGETQQDGSQQGASSQPGQDGNPPSSNANNQGEIGQQGSAQGEQQSSESGRAQQQGGSQGEGSSSQGQPSDQNAPSHDQSQANTPPHDGQSAPTQPPPGNPPRPPLDPAALVGSLFGWLGTLLKLIFYAVLLAVGVWLFRKYKDDLLAGFRELWNDFRSFWERLFGRKKAEPQAAAPVAETGPGFRPFSAYSDPFAAGGAGRYTPEQLVRYSFEAFEAWARERGCPRPPEQTPHEFAQQIAARNANLSQPARALAELYSRLAYAPGPLPPSTVEHLKQLWAALRG